MSPEHHSLKDLRERLVVIFTQRTGCRATANDIVQDAFAIALEKGNNSSKYVYGIAQNRMLSTLRRKGRDVALEADVEDSGSSAEEALHNEFTEHELQSLIKDLSPADRELLIRIAVNEQSQKEIAEDLGTAHATVRKRWERLRGHLRKTLAPISFMMFLVGMGGGTALTLSVLDSPPPPPSSPEESEKPRIVEVKAVPPPMASRSERSEREVEAELYQLFKSIKHMTLDLCVYGKNKRFLNPDLKIVFDIDMHKGANVSVSGKRSAKIKACIEREVMPMFLVAAIDASYPEFYGRGLWRMPIRFSVEP